MEEIRIVQIGLGPLGVKIAEFIGERANLSTVAAVDVDTKIVGKQLCDISSSLRSKTTVSDNLEQSIFLSKPHVAVVSTVSDMKRASDQIIQLVELGIPVVSTCEELAYPWQDDRELANRIDYVAKSNNVAVVGTGVNPGFLMDSLPSFLSSVCQNVEKVEVSRVQNATFRRRPFQQKIGANLTLDEFEERKSNGSLRHVGLTQSMQFIAGKMGWKLDSVEDIISPVIAEEEIPFGESVIAKGRTAGVHQLGRAMENGKERILLVFKAAIGEPSSFDEVRIIGQPNITSKIDGGVNGDIATCAIIVNATKAILEAKPGLRTMADLPFPTYFNNLKCDTF